MSRLKTPIAEATPLYELRNCLVKFLRLPGSVSRPARSVPHDGIVHSKALILALIRSHHSNLHIVPADLITQINDLICSGENAERHSLLTGVKRLQVGQDGLRIRTRVM